MMARSAKQVAAQHKASLASAAARKRKASKPKPKRLNPWDPNYVPKSDKEIIRMENLTMHAETNEQVVAILKAHYGKKKKRK